ncbi:MAG: hypothetical protein GC178_16415 [Flavobacteriales bacterium]|nr:hypothetical protein [Flavobacteriales bacterium]
MRKLLLILFALSCGSFNTIHAQESSDLLVRGQVINGTKNVGEAEITVCQTNAASPDCKEVARQTTKTNGKFEFRLKRDESYKIYVKKDGFKDRYVEMNTSMGDAETSNNPAWEFAVDISAYSNMEAPIKVATVYFDAKNNRFDYRLDSK